MVSIEEYFQQAKDSCRGCYYGFYDKHEQNIDYTTADRYTYMENALNFLERIKNFGGDREKEIAAMALKSCLGCIVNRKPKAKSIIGVLQKYCC